MLLPCWRTQDWYRWSLVLISVSKTCSCVYIFVSLPGLHYLICFFSYLTNSDLLFFLLILCIIPQQQSSSCPLQLLSLREGQQLVQGHGLMSKGRQVSPGAQLSGLWYNARPQSERPQEDTETLPPSWTEGKKDKK